MNAYLKIARPHQWLKNLMLFFPPFLGGVIFEPGVLQKGVLPFVIFCMASSATYVFNDIRDQEQDRIHPQKQNRPIASGKVSTSHATVIGAVLFISSVLLSMKLPITFWAWLIAYYCLSFAYSTVLKDQPIFDIFCIASGFVFRLFAGGVAFGVVVSDWLFLSVLLLAIFLSSGKRLSEKMMLGTLSGDHRKALKEYPEGVLEGFMYVSGSAVLVTYTMYVVTMHRLVFTVPLCCFGLFRYVLLVNRGESGDPTDSLVKDPVMFVIGLSWALVVGVSLYF